MVGDKGGLYREPLKKYLKSEGVNRSFLHDLIETCPGEAKYNQENDDVTASMTLGSATHCGILEPLEFDKRYVVLPADCRMGSGTGMKARKEQFEAEASRDGKTIIKAEDMQNIMEMQGAIHCDQNALNLLSGKGMAEVSGYYTEPETGTLCKFRADWLNQDKRINVDLKTAADVRHLIFRKSAYDHSYDLQAFSTKRGLEILTGYEHQFVFIVIASKGYHGLRIYEADEDLLRSGEEKYFRALEIYEDCKAKDDWPSYDSFPQPLGVPRFRKEQLDNMSLI